MAKIRLRAGGERFLLDEDRPYHVVFIGIDDFTSKKGLRGRNFKFVVLDKVALLEGDGDSFGKELKCLFWCNNSHTKDEDTGKLEEMTFPETGKYINTIKILAESKGLDDVDDTDEVIGGLCKVWISNDENTTDKGTATYSNVDSDKIKAVKEKDLEDVKKARKALKELNNDTPKKKNYDEDDEPAPKKKQIVEEDDEPVKKKKVVEEDDEPAPKKKAEGTAKKKFDFDD